MMAFNARIQNGQIGHDGHGGQDGNGLQMDAASKNTLAPGAMYNDMMQMLDD